MDEPDNQGEWIQEKTGGYHDVLHTWSPVAVIAYLALSAIFGSPDIREWASQIDVVYLAIAAYGALFVVVCVAADYPIFKNGRI